MALDPVDEQLGPEKFDLIPDLGAGPKVQSLHEMARGPTAHDPDVLPCGGDKGKVLGGMALTLRDVSRNYIQVIAILETS